MCSLFFQKSSSKAADYVTGKVQQWRTGAWLSQSASMTVDASPADRNDPSWNMSDTHQYERPCLELHSPGGVSLSPRWLRSPRPLCLQRAFPTLLLGSQAPLCVYIDHSFLSRRASETHTRSPPSSWCRAAVYARWPFVLSCLDRLADLVLEVG